MNDLISRQAAIDAIEPTLKSILQGNSFKAINVMDKIRDLPSAEPDFSCDGCQTPKHICGICMRNYPNITDHYCTGEAWREAKDETAV